MEKTKLLVMDFSMAFQFAYGFLTDDKKELARNMFNLSLSKHNIYMNTNSSIDWENFKTSEFQDAPNEEKPLKQDSSKSLQMLYSRWYEDVRLNGLESDSLMEAMKGSGFAIHEGEVLPVEEVERDLREKASHQLSNIDFLLGADSGKPIKTGMINMGTDIKVADKNFMFFGRFINDGETISEDPDKVRRIKTILQRREDLIDEMLDWFEKQKRLSKHLFEPDECFRDKSDIDPEKD